MRTDKHSPLSDPRVVPDVYVVHPTGYGEMAHPDKDAWCLYVVNGYDWGWSVRTRGRDGHWALNRAGEPILERSGFKSNKPRRWPLGEALRIALHHVDTHWVAGVTAAEADTAHRGRTEAGRL